MTEQSEGSAPSHRHRAREVALQALFALDLQRRRAAATAAKQQQDSEDTKGEPSADLVPENLSRVTTAEEVFDGISENFEMPAAVRAFARDLVIDVSACQDELDETLASQSKNWRVSRMAVVDRNILRLATYELIRTDTPAAVVLDEAVELARRFGSDPSPAFVNGVLDAVARKVRGEVVE